jgi:hypothetical protein
MKIGIIGSGNIGGTVGKLLAQAGHEVMFSFSRSQDKLDQLAADAGPNARAGTPAEAVAFGQVIVFSPPFRMLDNVLDVTGSLADKIVIDTTNPFGENFEVVKGDDDSAAEELARRCPGARVVKAFNHLHMTVIQEQHHAENRVVAFIAGDDEDAKTIVAGLVEDVGFSPHDLGDLTQARRTEPGGPLFNTTMTSY